MRVIAHGLHRLIQTDYPDFSKLLVFCTINFPADPDVGRDASLSWSRVVAMSPDPSAMICELMLTGSV